jgi:uncharacterized membrane protein YphA (DoxX/SURF4 family)
LFTTFPGEWPGAGLLLLRALVGLSLIVQGLGYVQTPSRGVMGWVVAVLAFTSAAFLLVGLMTPFVAVLVALSGICCALVWMPLPIQHEFDSHLAIINLIVLSIAIAFLGPGAFSLDARMFGRREITIPSHSPRT